ncbi:MAG: MerR family transcriptional regulator [Spirochaetaceae bacterium]|nr:MAG: MerR family transcriptional regulator [Spirochaetaceae bacterium]
MPGYLIGEVCRALDIKPHILRYWERQIPLLKPRKDRGGRRVYSAREMQILFRLRYLIRTRKFTTEGAADKIIDELSGRGASRKAGFQLLRETLMGLASDVQRLSDGLRSAEVPPAIAGNQRGLRAVWPWLCVSRRLAILRELELLCGDTGVKAEAAGSAQRRRRRVREPRRPVLAVEPWRTLPVQRLLPVSAVRPRVLLVSLCADAADRRSCTALLRRAATLIDDARESGIEINAWVTAVDPQRHGWLPSVIETLVPPGFDHGRRELFDAAALPLTDEQGLLYASGEREGLALYRCSLLRVVRALVVGPLKRLLDQVECVVIDQPPPPALPPPPPLTQLLGWFDPRHTDLAATAVGARRALGGNDESNGSGPLPGRILHPSGPCVMAPRVLIEALNSQAGVTVRRRERVLIAAGSGDDNRDMELCGFCLRTVDLLTAARSPRIFCLQECP